MKAYSKSNSSVPLLSLLEQEEAERISKELNLALDEDFQSVYFSLFCSLKTIQKIKSRGSYAWIETAYYKMFLALILDPAVPLKALSYICESLSGVSKLEAIDVEGRATIKIKE